MFDELPPEVAELLKSTPKTTVEPGAPERLERVLADPAGVPVHHTQIEAEKRHEEVEPASSLDQTMAWFFLGFAYTLIRGLDRSLFEIYQAAGNRSIPVHTHRAPRPIANVRGAEFSTNPWAYLIQGVPRTEEQTFIDFVASYRFRHQERGDYCCDFEAVRCADPLRTEGLVPVTIWFARPRNLQSGRHVAMLTSPGFMLNTPEFGLCAAPEAPDAAGP